VSCPKHPSKTIEYFCKHPQCSERLSCSSCLLKKQYCRHDINTYIVDIAELMYEQKMSFAMRGLSAEADIHDYLVNKDSRRKMYDDVVNAEIARFETELADMLKSITKTIEDLKTNIVGQLDEFKLSYQKVTPAPLRPRNSCCARSRKPSRRPTWRSTPPSTRCWPPRTTPTRSGCANCWRS
jgi:hypothetical protein